MFTGLVEAVGVLEEVEEVGDARRVRIGVGDKSFLSEAHVGESIAVSGVCLTATEYAEHDFRVSAVEETLRRTTLGQLKVGDFVNLERALKANARLGGHIVQGHVDGVGTIVGIREEGEGWWISFEPPFELMKHIVEKGSICIDGISLTVANVAYARFSVALIPHTREVTTASDWQIGKTVNLEADIIAKHVERLMVWNKEARG
jgi:riboflavin synthase